MSVWIQMYPGDSALELLLVTAFGATFVSGAAWLASRLFAGEPARRHLVLLGGLVSCLALPATAWVCKAAGVTLVSVPLLPRGPEGETPADASLGGGPAVAAAAVCAPAPAALRPVAMGNSPASAETIGEGVRSGSAPALGSPPSPAVPTTYCCPEGRPIAADTGPAAASQAEGRGGAGAAVMPASFREVATAVFAFWAAGTLWRLARFVRGCGGVIRLRRTSRPAGEGRILGICREVADRLGLRRPPLLLVTNRAVAPSAVGFGRPAIVLPGRLLGAVDDEAVRDVLLHEAAHLRRGDPWVMLLQGIAAALYWPVAPVHALNRELQRAREEVCDNIVLRGRDAVRYGETLLWVAELLAGARPAPASSGIFGGRGELERRIVRLVDPGRGTMTAAGLKAAAVAAVLFLAGVGTVSATRFAASAEPRAGEPLPSAAAMVAEGARSGGESPSAGGVREKADPSRTIGLYGTVQDSEGRPVVGARLYLNVDEWTDPIELGASGPDGSYGFEVSETDLRRIVAPSFSLMEKKALLIATAEGLGPAWTVLPSVEGGRMGPMRHRYDHDFRLVADHAIAGRVVDIHGKPVVGAAVSVSGLYDLSDPNWYKMRPAIEANDPDLMDRKEIDPTHWFTPLYRTAWRMIPAATADAEGRFRLAGAGRDRAVNLAVQGPGVRNTEVCVLTRDDVEEFTRKVRERYPRTPDPDGYFYPPRKGESKGEAGVPLFGPTPTIDADPARTISGVVRDAVTGEPVAGVQVAVQAVVSPARATTDRQGRYRIVRSEDKSAPLLYTRSDSAVYLDVVHTLADTEGLGAEIVADIELPRGVIVSGRVVEAGTDRPIVSAARGDCHTEWPGPLQTGNVIYYPLASNAALRGAPTGLYFEGIAPGAGNFSISAAIDPDGGFRLAVPPGPGVLLASSSPGMPMWPGGMTSKEEQGFHRLFPYLPLRSRRAGDGAAGEDLGSFPGFVGPISLGEGGRYHAYRVIDPPADAEGLDLKIEVPRGVARKIRFVKPDGRPLRGVHVHGLTAPPQDLTVELDDSEVEVFALEPGTPRQITAVSRDGKFAGRAVIGADDPETSTVTLEPTASVSGRVVSDSTGRPLAGYTVWVAYSDAGAWFGTDSQVPATTDAAGRFVASGLQAGRGVRISLHEPKGSTAGPFGTPRQFRLDSLGDLRLEADVTRDLGEIRVEAAAAKAEE